MAGKVKVNAMSYAKLLGLLVDCPSTYQELADHTGLHLFTVRGYVTAMRREKLVHITAWEQDRFGRDMYAVVKWGNGTNRPKHRYTSAERKARERAGKAAKARQNALFTEQSTKSHTADTVSP